MGQQRGSVWGGKRAKCLQRDFFYRTRQYLRCYFNCHSKVGRCKCFENQLITLTVLMYGPALIQEALHSTGGGNGFTLGF